MPRPFFPRLLRLVRGSGLTSKAPGICWDWPGAWCRLRVRQRCLVPLCRQTPSPRLNLGFVISLSGRVRPDDGVWEAKGVRVRWCWHRALGRTRGGSGGSGLAVP